MKTKPDIRALTKQIEAPQTEEAAVAEYIKISEKMKELEARKARLKPVLLGLTKGHHGEYIQIGKYEIQACDYEMTTFQLKEALANGVDKRILNPYIKVTDCTKILTRKHLG